MSLVSDIFLLHYCTVRQHQPWMLFELARHTEHEQLVFSQLDIALLRIYEHTNISELFLYY